jgi:hypothetical protein
MKDIALSFSAILHNAIFDSPGTIDIQKWYSFAIALFLTRFILVCSTIRSYMMSTVSEANVRIHFILATRKIRIVKFRLVSQASHRVSSSLANGKKLLFSYHYQSQGLIALRRSGCCSTTLEAKVFLACFPLRFMSSGSLSLRSVDRFRS